MHTFLSYNFLSEFLHNNMLGHSYPGGILTVTICKSIQAIVLFSMQSLIIFYSAVEAKDLKDEDTFGKVMRAWCNKCKREKLTWRVSL